MKEVIIIIRIKFYVPILLAISILCSCSNIEEPKSNVSSLKTNAEIVQTKESKSEILRQTKNDLESCGTINEISLISVEEQISLRVDSYIYNLSSEVMDVLAEPPVLKVIKGNDQNSYIVVYDYSLLLGVAGKEYNLYLFEYDNTKGIKLLWDGNLSDYEYKYKYSNNKIRLTFSDSKKEVEGEIINVVKNIEAQYKRIEPMSINEFLNGSITDTLSNVGASDYDGDGFEELITKHDVYNQKLFMYLSSIYTVWKIKNDNVYIYNSFIIDTHSFESRVINEIIKNGYVKNDRLHHLVEGKEDSSELLNQLAQKGIVKIQDSMVTIK